MVRVYKKNAGKHHDDTASEMNRYINDTHKDMLKMTLKTATPLVEAAVLYIGYKADKKAD